jgi:hypothetical protein
LHCQRLRRFFAVSSIQSEREEGGAGETDECVHDDLLGGWVGRRAGVKLRAAAARLHGPALFGVWFVSDPRVIRPTH